MTYKHTPGPWLVDDVDNTRIVTDEGFGIANAYDPKHRADTAAANARLIATSPEMYAASKILLERLAAYRNSQDWPQAMREAIEQTCAAIAKAEGR